MNKVVCQCFLRVDDVAGITADLLEEPLHFIRFKKNRLAILQGSLGAFTIDTHQAKLEVAKKCGTGFRVVLGRAREEHWGSPV